MDPVSLTIAITGIVIAVGATLAALCRKQTSSVNNNHDRQSTDGVEVNIGEYDKRTETFPDGRTVTTEKSGPTTIKIHETDSTVAAIGALSRADGYNTNTVAAMSSGTNAARSAIGPVVPALPGASQAPAASGAIASAQQPDAQIAPINLQDFANLKTDNRNIFTITEFTHTTKDGDITILKGMVSNTVSDGEGSQNDAGHTQLCKNLTSAIMPQINHMVPTLVRHVISSQQQARTPQADGHHHENSATELTPLLQQYHTSVQMSGLNVNGDATDTDH